jgi:hypothetical protein
MLCAVDSSPGSEQVCPSKPYTIEINHRVEKESNP